ncbi:Fe-S cluster assembly protein SufD [Paenibacillus sp. ACRRX]|uniref:Fe-S cluster assembly protein SufD n=1 Tax=unclassified Paenibacillus TaxID=185978 RepID=UPI001EF75096|nr:MULTISPECIES: Fe-S cluster assembly protein SufD [unclassified Paenibacillus]MCG7405826.1 Fe-S cluster assembly protein SufD [Paenibacillus sp. ACRRX]MDK8182271.1 Fe-S cluster assembly protein SufD [Paenibacillus sp. UMB4589-SE434]
MSTETVVPVDREAVAALSRSKQEPAWLAEQRLRALDKAATLENPKLEKTKIDRWNISEYGKAADVQAVANLSEVPAAARNILRGENNVDPSSVLVQVNSGVIYATLQDELKQQGVIFTDLETAAREHEELVKPYLMQAVQADEHRVAALHAAVWNGGAFLYVPKNVEVDIPLQALFYHQDANATFAPHVLIVADTNSRVNYVDNYISDEHDTPSVHNGVVEIFVKAGAKVTYASIHHLSEATADISFRRAIVENDGEIEWIVGEMHNGNAVSETTSILKGNGANSDAKLICIGNGEQKLNITTKAVHFGKSTNSQMITRAVMREAATAIINGITKIEKGATKADGQQTERVLMLSPKARGDANPILLIDEDDVTAGHAASAGQVNQEQVYYMMSRGISRSDAENLIIRGFLAPVVSDIPNEQLQQLLKRYIERKLGQ